MDFEIDVSGEDIFDQNYTICVADKNGLIRGFKMLASYAQIICSKYGQGLYRYNKSKKGKATLKVRVYCVIIYYIFRALNITDKINLTICRDFNGKEQDIKDHLKYLLGEKLGLNINNLFFSKLPSDSNAHHYSYLMRKDDKNQMQTYIPITIKEIEEYLVKK